MAESTSSGCQPIGVRDLAHRAGISLQDLEEECRDHHLLDFAALCDPWELVGYHLKLTQPQINAIKEDYNSHGAEMKRFMVLRKWKETVLTCTYRALVEAFLKCNKAQQALTICEAVKVHLSTTRDNEGREETSPQQIAHHDGAAASIQSRVNKAITESLRELDRHFSHVQMQLINTAGVTLRDLRLRISTLASFSGDPTQLLRSSTIEEFFHSLKQHCNALCPDILEDLIEQVGDEEAKREMREFKLKCEAFQRETKLKDMIGNYEGPTSVPLNYKELEIKLGEGWREKTLEDLENLQCRISLQSRLLKKIREGSLIVTYLVPISLNLPIENLISFLQELDVLQITMDMKCIYKQRLDAVSLVDLDMLLGELFDHLGHSWKFLARKLGFSETDIAALEHDNPFKLKEQIHQMFIQWRRREGNGATTDKILSALKAAGFDEQLKTLTERRLIRTQKGSAVLAGSLAAGVRFPIQVSDGVQSDSPVRSKTAPSATSKASPSERDFVRQQRLKRFSSSTSDKSGSDIDQYGERRTSGDPVSPQSTGACLRAESSLPPLPCGVMPDTNVISNPKESECKFEVDDLIQVDRPASAPWYGVIRWIGNLPGAATQSAGIEFENVVDGGGCGSFQNVEYFNCSKGHGLFLRLSLLKKDGRFIDAASSGASAATKEEKLSDETTSRGCEPTSTSDPLADLMSKLFAGDKKDTEQSGQSNTGTSGCKGFELQIPADRAGLVIGAGGKNIREVERLTNTSIKVDGGPSVFGGQNRKVLVIGREENCKRALFMIMKNIKRRVDEHTAGAKTISVPGSSVGRIIGKGGATISTIKSLSGAHDIKFENRKTGLEALLQTEQQCHIHGSEEAIEKAEKLIRLAIAGEDIVAGATFAAIFVELMKMGVQCQEESSS